nr:uncharacterized protein LOC113824246 [Penaeus vannamei]
MSAVVRRLASCMPSDAASTRRASCGTLDITASFAKSEAKSRERCASIGAQDLQKEQPTEEYLNHRRPSLDPLCLTPRTQASFVDSLRSPFLHLLKQSSFYESNAPHISSAHSPINATHTPLNSTHTTINSAHTPTNSTHSSLNTPHTPTSYAHSLTAPDENGTAACKQRPPATACNGLLQDASSRHYLMRRRHTLQQADLGASPEVPNPRKSSAPSLMSFPALSPCLEGKSKGANFFPLGRSDGDRGEEEPDQKEKGGWEGKEEKKEREEEEEEKRRVRKIPRIFVSDGNDERRRRILAREVLERRMPFSSGSCGTHPVRSKIICLSHPHRHMPSSQVLGFSEAGKTVSVVDTLAHPPMAIRHPHPRPRPRLRPRWVLSLAEGALAL